MLNLIRERAQGWIAWVIVGLLIIPFALWGINEYFGNGGRQVVATVNGTDISQRDFQQAFFDQRNRMQQMLGNQYDPAIFDRQIRQGVVNDLVDRELLRQYVNDADFRVSDTTVAATIRSIGEFQENGVFSSNLYEQLLQSQGLSATGFENRIKETLLVRQLPDGLANTAFVTDAELNELIRLQEQKRSIRFLTLPVSKYRDESVATEQAVQTYYDENQPRFMAPEQVRVEYIELDSKKLATSEQPDEQALRDLFDSRSSQYQVPEERKARHILITLTEDADDASVAAATGKAEQVIARIKSGESFEALAKEFSEDPGSAENGGDLGYFNRGTMEQAFEDATFNLKPGEVSGIVRTPFGLHIIQLDAVREASGKSFEDVRGQILKEYRDEEATKRYFDLAEQLTNLAFEIPDSLSEVAEQLNLELKQSEYFARTGGRGFFANPRVLAAAYKDDVLLQGFNSEPVEVGENHVVVLRVLEHKQASQRPLEDVYDQVKSQLIAESARKATISAGAETLNKLMSGDEATVVAENLALSWESVAGLTREGSQADPAITREAFRLNLDGSDKALGSTTLANGDVAVIELNAVIPGEASALEEAERESLKGRLSTEHANITQRYLLESLRSEAEITINTDDL